MNVALERTRRRVNRRCPT